MKGPTKFKILVPLYITLVMGYFKIKFYGIYSIKFEIIPGTKWKQNLDGPLIQTSWYKNICTFYLKSCKPS